MESMTDTQTKSTAIVLWAKRLAVLCALVAGFTGIGFISNRYLKASHAVEYLTHTITRGELAVTVTENGAVESSNNKEIKCLVKGGSTVLWVIETGTMVKPGDVLVRLDQSQIEDKILQQRIVYETALANKLSAESDVAVAKISITEYLEGTYPEDRGKVEQEIFDAEQALRQAQLTYESSMRLAAKGILTDLQLEGTWFSVNQAKQTLDLKKTRLKSLEKYNKDKMLQELRSTLKAAEAKLASYDASLELEEARLNREKLQLENCVIKSDTAGMVIFPSMAAWKDSPDIAEGATVREQQTLLMIPDISQMQVKVGIHESKVDRLKVGMSAQIHLQDLTLPGNVSEIAEVTRPAGWWTGNLVKYDTKLKLAPHPGLKPGMSAIVDIVLAKHENVLTIPVAAIVESGDGYHCWVQIGKEVKKRVIRLRDTNDEFAVVNDGLTEGEQVCLNPLAFVEEAQSLAAEHSKQEDSERQKPGDLELKKATNELITSQSALEPAATTPVATKEPSR